MVPRRTWLLGLPALLVCIGGICYVKRGSNWIADALHSGAALTAGAGAPSSKEIVVEFANPQQSIAGFGATDSWISPITEAQADLFFSPTRGIGLSILRVSIGEDGTPEDDGWGTPQEALVRNPSLFVWAAPWSPPEADKTTGNTKTGSIKATSYASWASVLAHVVASARENGVPLSAISAQNEPDLDTRGAYEMCLYDQNQLRAFIEVLGPALAALNPPAQLIMPETSNWNNLWGNGHDYVGTVMADSTAAKYVSIIATHQYGVPDPPKHALPAGTQLWETEMSDLSRFDPSIRNAVTVATWIHNAIVDGGVSAWHYWWLVNMKDDNEGLIGRKNDGTLTKRLYAMGNFSRFVRPGWVRLGTTGSVTGLLVSAYANVPTGDFVIVAINTTSSTLTASFRVAGPLVSSVSPYITSGTTLGDIGTDGNLSQGSVSANIAAVLPASTNAFSARIPSGVVTFVGKGSADEGGAAPDARLRSD